MSDKEKKRETKKERKREGGGGEIEKRSGTVTDTRQRRNLIFMADKF